VGGAAKSRSATNARGVSAPSAAKGGGGAGRMHYAWAGMLGEQRMSRALRGVVPLRGLRRRHLLSPAEAATAGEESFACETRRKLGSEEEAAQRDRRVRLGAFRPQVIPVPLPPLHPRTNHPPPWPHLAKAHLPLRGGHRKAMRLCHRHKLFAPPSAPQPGPPAGPSVSFPFCKM